MKKSIILITLGLFFSITEIYACSCARFGVEKSFNGSDIVFSGKVTEIITTKMIDTIQINNKERPYIIKKSNRIEFKFKVIKLFKGEMKTKFLSIYTTGGLTDCGNYFPINSKHLIYSYIKDAPLRNYNTERKVDPYFSTNLCTRTKELKRTKRREIKELKKLSGIR